MSVVKIKKSIHSAIAPLQEQGSKNRYSLYTPYNTTVAKGATETVSSGIYFDGCDDLVVLTLGNKPSEWDIDIEIKEEFFGTGKEIGIKMVNHTECDIDVTPFTKITSFYLIKACGGDPEIVDDLDATERGNLGFGSTGLK